MEWLKESPGIVVVYGAYTCLAYSFPVFPDATELVLIDFVSCCSPAER